MKLIIYGGCHANHLAGFIKRLAKDEVEIETLINFQLIQSGEAFPLERLGGTNGFICSPVNNKPGFNTKEIIEYCEKKGIMTYTYPWLRFDGYFPLIKRVMNGWRYIFTAEKGDIFDDKCLASQRQKINKYLQIKLTSEYIQTHIDESLNELRRREKAAKSDFKLSSYVQQCSSDKPLFFTPEHASNAVYEQIALSILHKFGLDTKQITSDNILSEVDEVQSLYRVPIFEQVAKHFGVSDEKHLYYNSIVAPRAKIKRDDFFLTSLYQESGFCKAKQETLISSTDTKKSSELPHSSYIKIAKGQEFTFIKAARGNNGKDLLTIIHELTPGQYFNGYIYRPHWKIGYFNGENKTYLKEDIRSSVTSI